MATRTELVARRFCHEPDVAIRSGIAGNNQRTGRSLARPSEKNWEATISRHVMQPAMRSSCCDDRAHGGRG